MKLNFQSVSEKPDLVARPVYQQLQELEMIKQVKVAAIDPANAAGDQLSQHYDIPYQAELNCLVVQGKRQENLKYAALLVPYGHKANTGSVTKHALDVSKVSFAPLDYVLAQTKMELGSITPIGLPREWKVMIDASVFEQANVVIGSGLLGSKLLLSPAVLQDLPNAVIVDKLAK